MSDWKYPLSEPTLGPEDEEALLECVRSGWLSMGPRTRRFEEEFAAMHGVRHAIAVSNGTAALHLALMALGIDEGEIVQPSINFVAAANMTRAVGATPVFADIVSLEEPTIDPDEVERLIGPRTKAVIAMHYGGYPARMAEIAEMCRARGLWLIEDACHAPCQPYRPLQGRMLGTIGQVGCFSFFSNKNLTTGEGGMVVTDDDDIAARVRTLRSHGMTSLTWERHNKKLGTYDVLESGFNYRTDDIRAALGLSQLGRLAEFNAARTRLARAYVDAVTRLGEGRMRYVFSHKVDEGTGHVGAILVDPARRDALRQALGGDGIQTSLHYPPVHAFTAFEKGEHGALERTEAFARSVVTLPLYPRMSPEAPAEIIAACTRHLAAGDATPADAEMLAVPS